jgi:hypothetical protein
MLALTKWSTTLALWALASSACFARARTGDSTQLGLPDSGQAVELAKRLWDDYRRQNSLHMREMQLQDFARSDSSYPITLWPVDPRTRGGGVVIEVRAGGAASILRILD